MKDAEETDREILFLLFTALIVLVTYVGFIAEPAPYTLLEISKSGGWGGGLEVYRLIQTRSGAVWYTVAKDGVLSERKNFDDELWNLANIFHGYRREWLRYQARCLMTPKETTDGLQYDIIITPKGSYGFRYHFVYSEEDLRASPMFRALLIKLGVVPLY